MQAKYAKEAQEEATKVGEGLFAGVQCKCPVHCGLCVHWPRLFALAVVILSWYYFYHAR